jgi:hypothetical protein
LLRRAGMQWINHKDARLGAALAYYSVFSLPNSPMRGPSSVMPTAATFKALIRVARRQGLLHEPENGLGDQLFRRRSGALRNRKCRSDLITTETRHRSA